MGLLICQNAGKRFGGVIAVKGVSFEVNKGEIVGLIGPNGAGKTTLFNVIAGSLKPTEGKILFDGHDITGLPSYKICHLGIARTFQITRPFLKLSCLENVGVAIINRRERPKRGDWKGEAITFLEQVGLSEYKERPAQELNVIQKKRLELARALATRPQLLLLDEVLGGLNTQEIGQAVELIRQLRERHGITILWIEHIMGAIMKAADRIILLDQGQKLLEGTPEQVVKDPRTIKAYLGEG